MAPGLRSYVRGGIAGRHAVPHRIRVIEYQVDDGRSNDTTYRLFTTILDPDDASAVDLATAYAQRWEIETAFDELKTHQRGPEDRAAVQACRSRLPGDLGVSMLPLRDPDPDGGCQMVCVGGLTDSK